MIKLFLLFLTISLNAAAQDFVQRKDGTKIMVADGSIYVEPSRKKIGYQLKDSKKVHHIKYKELDVASYGDFLFKTFTIGKKTKGYFLIAESAGKKLVSTTQKRVKSGGGFDSVYTYYEVGVLDRDNNFIEFLTFTNRNIPAQIAERSQIVNALKVHFQDCPNLLEKLALFESPSSDVNFATVLVFFDSPAYVKCL